ncbi:MAG: tryptophan--tRNA ligase [Clostridia bacterium]|nr:tryptophan--tRNA ligase [Clostridia bacterium]
MESTERTESRKTVLSGIQPTSRLTLGNYLGALKNFVAMQEEFDSYYMVADMHAITVRQESSELRRRSVETAALFMACGIDPEKSTLFIQSSVPEHVMLSWVLNCNTYMGELNRMTQFKDKSARHADNINAGLFTYPVLMASDILLYQAHLIPVGADQKQHVELTRDLAERFNKLYGETFVVPEPFIPKVGARIMSLQEPENKMSKSDPNPNGYIAMLDDPDTIVRKIKRAVTDCEGCIAADPARPGVYNLLTIYSACSGKTMEEAVGELEGQGYGTLKVRAADAVVAVLEPIQKEYGRILKDKQYLNDTLVKGAEKAQKRARRTVSKVYHKVGFDSVKR